jgi:hypothetical protein
MDDPRVQWLQNYVCKGLAVSGALFQALIEEKDADKSLQERFMAERSGSQYEIDSFFSNPKSGASLFFYVDASSGTKVLQISTSKLPDAIVSDATDATTEDRAVYFLKHCNSSLGRSEDEYRLFRYVEYGEFLM